ncbi:DUF4494 domain-containing protein [Fibrella forsythiae]|uniref:DUF4494 domain-containing protein n=1 Tax=Fibrella forsythiae TaxID=2817061 RepID=A0ABS3JD21_9BACT|nr:DUF4494 domain-containing protein [Fibrella forsythiae]MBO0947341.1 DUF4494 domain-containing protein [Fibrella forsythiae]
MPTWFIGSIRYQQQDDSVAVDTRKGADAPRLKTIKESYLIDAVSYTDAEARLYRIVADNTPDFEIVSIRPMRLSDVFHIEGGDNWYKVKGFYMTETAKGVAKKVNNVMLINAASLKEAHERITEQLSSMLVPVEITDINLTPILEVVPHDALEDEKPVETGKTTIIGGDVTVSVQNQKGEFVPLRGLSSFDHVSDFEPAGALPKAEQRQLETAIT